MDKLIVLNLFAQPGGGKSSTFGTGFGYLKNRGVNVEMSPEKAKPMVYAGRQREMKNQVFMFSEQYKPIRDIADDGKVAIAITDCPLLMGIVYAEEAGLHYTSQLEALIYRIHEEEFDNVNVFITRDKPYNPFGRNQTEAESDALVDKIRGLTHFDYEIEGNEAGQIWLANEIIERFGERIMLPGIKPNSNA